MKVVTELASMAYPTKKRSLIMAEIRRGTMVRINRVATKNGSEQSKCIGKGKASPNCVFQPIEYKLKTDLAWI
jgi:hypothetical protein